jgi:hypothetical protein
MQKGTEYFGPLTVQFGFLNIQMVRLTLAHAQTHFHVSQFGHGNQEIVDA